MKKPINLLKGLKVPKSIKINKLPDAILDGKIRFNIGDNLIFRRDYLPAPTTSYVTVTSFNSKTGLIELFDDTKQQQTAVEISDASKYTLKCLSEKKVRNKEKEFPNDVPGEK